MKIVIVSLFVILSFNCFCQSSNSNIWVLDIKNINDKIVLSNAKQITTGEGYHNQPAFSKDSKVLYYTSGPEATQTDIYKYSLENNKSSHFTSTTVSEYSPTLTPDEKGISVVVVEPDKRQRLWQYPFSGTAPFTLFPTVDSIGYFSWLDGHSLVAFKLGNKIDSNKLLLISGNGDVKVLAQNIGRGLKVYNHSAFFIKKKDSTNYIALTDLKEFKIFSKTPGNSEHFAVYKDYILMSDGAAIYAAKILFANNIVSGIAEFHPIQDLSADGLKNISRIAVSPDNRKIAIVTSN